VYFYIGFKYNKRGGNSIKSATLRMKNFAFTRQYVESSKYFQANPNPQVVHDFSAPGIGQAKDEFFRFVAMENFDKDDKIFDCDGNEIMSKGDDFVDDGSFRWRLEQLD
jgi:hypothetical protein